MGERERERERERGREGGGGEREREREREFPTWMKCICHLKSSSSSDERAIMIVFISTTIILRKRKKRRRWGRGRLFQRKSHFKISNQPVSMRHEDDGDGDQGDATHEQHNPPPHS